MYNMLLTFCLLSLSAFGAFGDSDEPSQKYAMDCKYTVPGKDVSYDLENFPNGKIIVPASTGFGHNSFEYIIGVCNNLPAYPETDITGQSYCEETLDHDGTPVVLSSPGAAYRYRKPEKLCELIGRDAADGKLTLDIDDFGGDSNRWANMYARGVELRYTGGNTCLVNGKEIERSVNVLIECDPTQGITTPPRVSETASCKYDIVVPSVQGCPLQCRPNNSLDVCNNKGICGYDTSSEKAKCYCFDGWMGEHCTKQGFVGPPPGKSYSSRVAGGLFGGLLLGLALAIGAFMIRAKLNGSDFRDGLDFARTFPSFFGGPVAKVTSVDGFFSSTADGPQMGSDAQSAYTAPDLVSEEQTATSPSSPEVDEVSQVIA